MNAVQVYEPKTVTIPIFSEDKIELIKRLYCVGATDDELKIFFHICKKTGLDPLSKQIYAIKIQGKLSVLTAIDGYRLIAERTGKYSPGREPTFTYNENGHLVSCTAYIKKQTEDGTWHEVAASAFFQEYYKPKVNNRDGFWQKMPHVMIAKVAESLALRKAFPNDLSGLYTEEEMDQAKKDNEIIEEKPIPKIELKKQKISQEQIDELIAIMNKCSAEYQSKLWEGLATQKVYDWSELTLELYERVKIAAIKQAKNIPLSVAQ